MKKCFETNVFELFVRIYFVQGTLYVVKRQAGMFK